MNFTAVWKLASAVSLASLLTACGGGGGGEDSTPFQPGQGSITIQATRTTLPNNVYNVSPFLGSPYMSELTVTVKTASGQLVNAADGLAVSVNPVGNTGGFSTLDDGTTADVNEFLVRLGQGPVDITAGKSTLFLHSFEFTGTTTLTVTATDPETRRTMTASQVFTIVSNVSNAPATVLLSPTTAPVYIQGSGGNTTGQMEIRVNDGIGQPVPNPTAGNNAWNNVKIDLVGDGSAAAGERVTAINAAGQSVSGQSIAVNTTAGISALSFISGNRTGSTIVRVTADRADNNVDNGIQDAVTAERAVIVSDGRLFSLKLTSPFLRAITANPIDPTVVVEEGELLPLDGTYSLTVSAIATDRQGNPVLVGTPIEFGLIDEPAFGFPEDGPGFFSISGVDGNPQEDGFLFTAPTGAFRTAGGGAGPGDTVVVFGEDVAGNRDLESARTVSSVTSQTSLSVVQRFNRNDDTGAIVDYGNVLPYVVGRATDGNIGGTAVTDENGVATTQMNYPVSMIGKAITMWARGTASTGVGQELITDAEIASFPAISPLTLTASPSTIPGNNSALVTVCLVDATGAPVQGVFVDFGFSLASGTGRVDGVAAAGSLETATGSGGCAVADVETSGMTQTGDNQLIFSAGSAEPAVVEVVLAEGLILQATPSTFVGDGTHTVTLRLIDGSGNPVVGAPLTGTCTAGSASGNSNVSLLDQIPLTNSSGSSTVRVRASEMDGPNERAEWTCTFSAAGGEPTADVLFIGRDVCLFGTSPPPTGCDNDAARFTVTLNLTGGAPGGNVTSTPEGLSCTVASGGSIPCTAQFDEGATITVVATQGAGGDGTVTSVTGECTTSSLTSPVFVIIPSISAARTCNINFQ